MVFVPKASHTTSHEAKPTSRHPGRAERAERRGAQLSRSSSWRPARGGGGWPPAQSHVLGPPRGRTRTAHGRARARLQAAARQVAGAAARTGSGHQGGPRGAGGAECQERGCHGRHRPVRCRRGRRAFE
eukprot:scaffold44775_cov59-Phaeocystis_antarctica.AAC.3